MIAVYFSEQASVISVRLFLPGIQKMDKYQSNDFAPHILQCVSHKTHLCPMIATRENHKMHDNYS